MLLLNAPVKVKKTDVDKGIGNCTDIGATKKFTIEMSKSSQTERILQTEKN